MTEIRVKAILMFKPPWDSSSISGGPERFRARLAFDPATAWGKESIKLLEATRLAVAIEKWKTKAKAEAVLESIENDKNKESYFKKQYRNADGEPVEGFEGMYHLSTLSEVQPLMLDSDRSELSKRDHRLYSGCHVVAKIDIWAQKNEHGNGMRATILGLQFWKDGPAFSGQGRASVDDFDDLSNLGDDDDTPAPKKKRAADDDDDAPAPKKKRAPPPAEDDDDDIA